MAAPTRLDLRWPWPWLLGLVGLFAMFFLAQRSTVWARDLDDYRFDPKRVGLGEARPAWLEAPMARALFGSYLVAAGEPFSLLDQEALDAFLARVRGLPWVAAFDARPKLPNGLELDLVLRRPVATALDRAGRLFCLAGDGTRLPLDTVPARRWFSKELGTLLQAGQMAPDSETAIASPTLPFGLPLLFGLALLAGDVFSGDTSKSADANPVHRAAAALLSRLDRDFFPWLRSRLALENLELPDFLGLDCSNFDYQLALDRAEFRLIFLSGEQRPVLLEWGHSATSRFEVIAWERKARIFLRILKEWPAFAGLRSADLRFENLWRERIVPREHPGH